MEEKNESFPTFFFFPTGLKINPKYMDTMDI